MARKKNDTPKAPKAPKAPRKPRAPKDPNAPVKPWVTRQLERLARLHKLADKLAKRFAKVNAPGDVAATMAQATAGIQEVFTTLAANTEFAPKVRAPSSKAAIGDKIVLLDAAKEAPIFKSGLVAMDLYTDAEIVADDRTYWLVRCTDDQVRAIAKKLVTAA